MLIMASILCFTSCSKEDDGYTPQEVDFSLDYTFVESGNMARASGTDVYNNFYEKYIKTKQLTPRTYYLEFFANEEKILTINGQWGTNTGIRLPEGEYRVVGYSYPIETYAEQPQYLPSDTVYITFDENVNIIKDMTILTLNAKYDSYLLLFDKANKQKIELNIGQRMLNHDESCYWIFSKIKSWTNWDNGFSFTHYFEADIFKSNGDCMNLIFGKLPLENNKYYYFNDMTNSFDIPQMESGN